MIALEEARRAWSERQGLAGAHRAGLADVVAATGWLYSAGGAGPYLALRARCGATRSQVDRALFEEVSLLEVPCVRGCSMIVPRADVALALAAARRVESPFKKPDVRALAKAVLRLLAKGAASAHDLRDAVPAKLVKKLGVAGRKAGYGTTMAVALRELQLRGLTQRVMLDGRAVWRLMEPPAHWEGDLDRELAGRFFRWAGPATLAEFAWWAGIPQKQATKALEGLARVEVEGRGESWSAGPVRVPRATKAVHFLPFRDNLVYFRRGMSALTDSDARLLDWENRPAKLQKLESLHNHAIVVDGELAGVWEYDPVAREVVTSTWKPVAGLEERRRELEAYVRRELVEVWFYALDRREALKARLRNLRTQR